MHGPGGRTGASSPSTLCRCAACTPGSGTCCSSGATGSARGGWRWRCTSLGGETTMQRGYGEEGDAAAAAVGAVGGGGATGAGAAGAPAAAAAGRWPPRTRGALRWAAAGSPGCSPWTWRRGWREDGLGPGAAGSVQERADKRERRGREEKGKRKKGKRRERKRERLHWKLLQFCF